MADTINYGTTPDREGKDRYFNTIVELPSAREFGPGLGIIGEPAALKVSNGIEWSPYVGAFTPSIFSGAKTATTTVDDQAELFAEGATRLDVSHMNTTNDLIIGFGRTLAEARTACSSGTAGVDKFLLLKTGLAGMPITLRQFRGAYTAYAWLGVGGTVECLITQGV